MLNHTRQFCTLLDILPLRVAYIDHELVELIDALFSRNGSDTVFYGRVLIGADGMRFTLDPLSESVPPTTKVVESETSLAGS
jgi:hypothetical protein